MKHSGLYALIYTRGTDIIGQIQSDLKTESGYLRRLSSYCEKIIKVEFVRCSHERFFNAKPYKTITF